MHHAHFFAYNGYFPEIFLFSVVACTRTFSVLLRTRNRNTAKPQQAISCTSWQGRKRSVLPSTIHQYPPLFTIIPQYTTCYPKFIAFLQPGRAVILKRSQIGERLHEILHKSRTAKHRVYPAPLSLWQAQRRGAYPIWIACLLVFIIITNDHKTKTFTQWCV